MATDSNLRITLDGSHALVSNVSQHSAKRGDFVVFKDVYTDVANRIVKRDGKGATLGSVAGTEIQVIKEYIYVDPATGAESVYVIGAINAGNYIYVSTNGGATWTGQTLPISPTSGGRWFFETSDNRVFAVNGIDVMLVAIQTAPNTLTWKKAGQAAPSTAATYSLATNDPPYNTGTVSMTQGSPGVLGIGTTFTAGMVGKDISINGVDYTILAFVDGTHLTLTENFKEVSATYAYNIYRGVGDWITGPRYAYSYRNPTTGHMSNVSPVLEITEQNQFGRTITITIAGSAENTAAYNNGYTQIQLFRSALNAYTLVALNEFLNNNATASAITYVETAVKFADTYLGTIQAPFDVCGVPPAGIRCLAFNQDRMWAITLDGRLRFTPTLAEMNQQGVYNESWPPLSQYSRVAPSRPTGLLVVGGSSVSEILIIQTAKGDYSVDGFDPLTFRVFRIKTRYSGGFLYSATSVDGTLVEFYRDKRLLVFPDQNNLGIFIQDKLKKVKTSLLPGVRLHWFAGDDPNSSSDPNYLLLSVPSTSSSTANDYTFVFDLEKEALIYEWNAGFSAFGTVHDPTTGELQLWAGDSTGAVYRLLGGATQDAGANFQPVIKTSIIRPLGVESWSGIAYVELYVHDATNPWTGRIFIHEQTSTGATDGTVTAFTFKVAPPKSQSAQGKKLVFKPSHTIRTESEALQLEVTFPSENAANWIEQIVIGIQKAEERVG